MPRRRDYNPWEVPEERYQAMPKREQQWVRELKVRRRLYQMAAVLPLIGWPLYLLILMVQYFQQASGLDGLFSLVGLAIMIAIFGTAVVSAVFQVSPRRSSRIAGYILGGLLNLGAAGLTLAIHRWDQTGLSPVGSVVLFLILLSCVGSFVLIVANLKLAPYLEAEEDAKHAAEDRDEERRGHNWLPEEPDSKW